MALFYAGSFTDALHCEMADMNDQLKFFKFCKKLRILAKEKGNAKCCILEPKKKTPWPESESELYRRNDRSLSAKLVPSFVDRGCHVVRVMDP
jgi:hypothetical protein